MQSHSSSADGQGVSIEDTREITLFHENWIASVTREMIAEGANIITMFDLLRAAMRQRPEYILVGEVRGVEAQTLFQAMNTGHTTFPPCMPAAWTQPSTDWKTNPSTSRGT